MRPTPDFAVLLYPSADRAAAPCLFCSDARAHPYSPLSPSLFFYFISVPSSSLRFLRPIPPVCSPVVGSADFFLGYRPVDRAAIRWTAIRIDYSLPKLRRGAFILYNSPAALSFPFLSGPLSSLLPSARCKPRVASRARRHPCRARARAIAPRVLVFHDTRSCLGIDIYRRVHFENHLLHMRLRSRATLCAIIRARISEYRAYRSIIEKKDDERKRSAYRR